MRSPCRCPISRAPTLKEYSPRRAGPAVTPGYVVTESAIEVMPVMVEPSASDHQWQLVLRPIDDVLAAARLGTAQHRVADLGGAVAVLEGRSVRADLGVVADRAQEVV